MSSRVLRLGMGVICALTLASCATLSTARTAKGSGASRVFSTSFKTVWQTTHQAIGMLGPSIVSSNENEGTILAETSISAFSWGEAIAVFVEKVDDSHTRVEVVSKRKLATNIIAYNWENRVLDKVDALLSTSKTRQ